ncbi:hypothetical protein [Arthrobacter sp. NtRootA1]|uniref:hypothetical protein n=1 Tax=Arthrobacter sp. NtRootA1 TaxID=2830983 RepID=UPI001CC7380A|nr:hypothetical protein [Arthrobacter sp. NtRootA1]BCW06018.1 hypothetical protein NtRootA1_21560 [Arthrobacter sp. NtRootA1]
MDEQNIDVFIGLDVEKSGHHAAPMAPRFPRCPASLSDEKIRPSPPPTCKRTETTNLKSPPGGSWTISIVAQQGVKSFDGSVP